eukprot:scaffold29785_cov51-Phaeocystis_antarctica.AAC.2
MRRARAQRQCASAWPGRGFVGGPRACGGTCIIIERAKLYDFETLCISSAGCVGLHLRALCLQRGREARGMRDLMHRVVIEHEHAPTCVSHILRHAEWCLALASPEASRECQETGASVNHAFPALGSS